MVPQQVSFVERLSLSQRVPYQRFHCTHYIIHRVVTDLLRLWIVLLADRLDMLESPSSATDTSNTWISHTASIAMYVLKVLKRH